MFDRILIANRGEIAVRIIRACREMGIMSIAVYSQADKNALHTQLADRAVCIGPAKSRESYLNMQNIISAACLTGAQAIHPGFGFLSENSVFASMCGECNIKFIGPDPQSIDLMGNKANARKLMSKAGVPVTPGSESVIETAEEAASFAEELGFPVMIKASAGGGGKGIRIVKAPDELESAFYSAKAEAKAAFGDDSLYMEKLIENARHIEVQILSDEYGNVVHLGERDCSMQIRNQKVIEESPSPAIDDETRQKLGQAAIRAVKASNYKNAGTIEFLYSPKDGSFYFMEMNTRVQVEHPITEMVTDVDIIKEQIKIAAGEKLSIKQSDIKINSHSIECRINAQDPENNFRPSPGTVNYLLLPGGGNGLRVDSAIYAGYTIPPYYDSMLAKVITKGKDRNEAIIKMKRALSEFVIEGVKTNIDFQLELLNNKDYLNGNYDTSFITEKIINHK